jgi:hypothetical protein
VGTQRGSPREQPLWERSKVAREGVTCITCHRVNKEFNKVNGEREVLAGNIHQPVYNAGRGANYAEVAADLEGYGVALAPQAEGRSMHAAPIKFEHIAESEFCVSCHQVAVHPGIKLEVVWEQYRDSPAAKAGITCQECHMGTKPGEPSGYDTFPIAIVNGKVVGSDQQRHSNHMFFGPGYYPIAHPGLFPFNPLSLKWTIEEWLAFDYRSDWGKPEFEQALAEGKIKASDFPTAWRDAAVRGEARAVLDQNLKLLGYKRQTRIQVMENGSRLEGPFFDSPPRLNKRLKFRYRVHNIDPGHNLPSGSLGAQPEIWLNVVLVGPDGESVFESGYVDANGDMADLHSLEVAKGRTEHDDQLFNLQTKFLTTNVKGTDREMYLPVNFDIDQIPFIRPAGVPTSVLNHPPFIRMEQRSIAPLGYRDAKYSVPETKLSKPGTYTLQARLRSRAEPIYFMRFVGATIDMEQAMNEWMIDLHPQAASFELR